MLLKFLNEIYVSGTATRKLIARYQKKTGKIRTTTEE